LKRKPIKLKYHPKRTWVKMGNNLDKKNRTNRIIKREITKQKIKISMKKRLKKKEKKVLKKIRSRKINLLMKVTLKILQTHLVALFNLKGENPKAIVQLATERTRKKIKKNLETDKEIEIERKKKRKTRTNLKK